jgi:hypothetical protein
MSSRKRCIPKPLRRKVWDAYFSGSTTGLCYTCRRAIDIEDYECGHIVAEAAGGETVEQNLRPVCRTCNRSMGTTNMDEFAARFSGDNARVYNVLAEEDIQLVALICYEQRGRELSAHKHVARLEEMFRSAGYCAQLEPDVLDEIATAYEEMRSAHEKNFSATAYDAQRRLVHWLRNRYNIHV